ncbi:MAG: cytidine/deoxycytidylate deaminase family protein [Deltaproteobacteria bacterium]|nr:cytidine/deoxycytidylate deaminase family protein [Deltaproteobacteria bacterium]
MEYDRPSWNQYFMSITRMVATRSTCLRRHVGAILVKENRILATGYNGAPAGLKHCIEVGCLREKASIPSGTRHELCRALHAEQNAIVQAAYHGISIAGSTLYCTNKPCVICSKMLINSGIKKIFFDEAYDDALADALLDEAGIKIMRFSP